MPHSQDRFSDWIIKNHRRYIVINKPAGLSVQRTKDNEAGLEQIASSYAKLDLHVINRIDRPVSGVVIMAKDSPTAAVLNEVIQDKATIKTYIAIVQKVDIPEKGKLEHYLRKTNNKSMVCTADHPSAKAACLNYEVVKELDNYLILEIQTETGRFHQIRAQLAAIGAFIKGDVKYGARRGNKDRSIHLHALSIKYHDPIGGQDIEWKADMPKDTLWAQYQQ